ncbi:Rv3235 family protein [Streptomyces nigrescens]|uniref:Rv3235 family protein n=1 Tax=Streptomyces nigrescens TaxID=1920 RepID=UPI0022530289|nr:Rv3235 family protein [Streptomyces libani]MCX5451684.1 Rv3235 family protein [Streptomyces libani]
MTGTDHSTAPTTPTATGRTTRPAAPATSAAPEAPDDTGAGRGPRSRPAGAPVPAVPAVPRPRRSPADRRPLGPAGSGPGSSGRSGPGTRGPGSGGRGPGSPGRGAARTAPRLARPAAAAAAESRRIRTGTPASPAGAPLPTVGARRRAHESRPHHWFAQQLVLALSGQRPVHALLGHALPAAYDRLAELAPQAPLRPATGPGRRGPAPTVRDCGLCRPCRGVIEAFARITAGERLRALAFRLELGADSRWRCAALDIGPAPALRCPAS